MRIVMMGTGTFAEPTFEALLSTFGSDVVGLVTQPEREGGNKRGSTRQTGTGMATIAAARGVMIAQPESINTPAGLEQLRALRPDLLVVAAYGQLLSREVLAIPTRGTINVHASLLPNYRGAAPIAYAILSGERQTGVTIIKVTPGLDSGDMILQEAIDIFPDDTTGSLEGRLSTLGARLAVVAVRKYQASGAVEGVRQEPALVSKAPKIKKEFGLIDWSRSAEYIERFVRAMQPWPTAYSYLHRPEKEPLRVIVNQAGSLLGFWRDAFGEPEPGRCAVDQDGALWVCTGEGQALHILELQPAGKKRMSTEEFLRGHPIVKGMCFGPEVRS